MMTPQILKSVDYTKQKHKNLKISRTNIIFSSNKKIHQSHIKCYFTAKKSFVAEVTFNNSINYTWVLLVSVSWFPNSNIFTKVSSLRLVILPKTSVILFERVRRIFEEWWQCSKKCEVDSISRLQLLIKLWRLRANVGY